MKKVHAINKTFIILLMALAGLTVKGQTITTDNVSTITSTTAYAAATVTNVGSGITERGVCYGLVLNPTTADSKVSDGITTLGSFEVQLTSLTNPTNYHVRAYVISGGISYYGADIPFTTFAPSAYAYSCKAQNDFLVDAATYQFDVYIYSNTSPTSDLWLNNYQLGFEIWNVGSTAGTLTGSYVSGSSQLTSGFTPATTPLIFRADMSGGAHFDMVIAGPPASSSGMQIPYSASGPGTRIGTFQIVHHDISAGPATAFPTGIQLNMVWDNDVLGKTVIYAISPPGASGTVVNNTNFTAHSPYLAPGTPLTNPTFNTAQWTGVISTDWLNPSNWKPNPTAAVPTAATEVLITGGLVQYPLINSANLCNTAQIQDGGKITIASNGSLTVNGNLTMGTNSNNINPILIQSDITGTGSLITKGTISGTGVANAQVQRYLTTDVTDAWHLISAPISNAVSGMFLDQYLRPFNESGSTSGSWGSFINDLVTPLTPGTGFICWPIASQAFTYTGPLNTGTITPGLTRLDATHGNNLVGNPYPSAIDWNAATGWVKTNLGLSIYVYNPTTPSHNYAIWDGTTSLNGGSRYIAIGQGFFVQAIAASPGLSMNDNVRVHNTQAFLKNADPENALKLHAQNTRGSDEIVIRFDESSSPTYDPRVDTRKMYGDPSAPQLFSLKPGDPEQLSISVMPEITNALVIPVCLQVGLNDQYSITASQMESFPPNVSIYLEDISLGNVQDMKAYPVYSFAADTDDVIHRFNLHISNFPYGIPGKESDNGLQIYSYGQTVYVRSNTSVINNARIFVYDALGRTLYQTAFNVNTLNKFDLHLTQGNYIVKLVTNSGVQTQKVFIN